MPTCRDPRRRWSRTRRSDVASGAGWPNAVTRHPGVHPRGKASTLATGISQGRRGFALRLRYTLVLRRSRPPSSSAETLMLRPWTRVVRVGPYRRPSHVTSVQPSGIRSTSAGRPAAPRSTPTSPDRAGQEKLPLGDLTADRLMARPRSDRQDSVGLLLCHTYELPLCRIPPARLGCEDCGQSAGQGVAVERAVLVVVAQTGGTMPEPPAMRITGLLTASVQRNHPPTGPRNSNSSPTSTVSTR